MAGRNVSYLKPKTPSFIAQFKERVGYKEPDTIEKKFEKPDSSQLDDRELEDESPTVVLGSNVSEAEANVYLSCLQAEEEAKKTAEDESRVGEGDDSGKDGGKIVFKKPVKRKSMDSERQSKSKADDRKKAKMNSTMKSVKNKTLLSFDEEEDEA